MTQIQLPAQLESQVAAISTALAAQHTSDHGIYALIDLAASTETDAWLARLRKHRNALSLFAEQPEAAAPEQAPWLVQLLPEERLLKRSVVEALIANNTSWIVTSLDFKALAARLSARLTAQLLPQQKTEALFRYYDPRLFPGWWTSLTEEERCCFGTFGHAWLYLDADLTLSTLTLLGITPTDPVTTPWQVTAGQLATLTLLSERHQLTDFLHKRQPDRFSMLSPGEQWAFVCREDEAALAQQISGLADRLKHCERVLLQQP